LSFQAYFFSFLSATLPLDFLVKPQLMKREKEILPASELDRTVSGMMPVAGRGFVFLYTVISLLCLLLSVFAATAFI